MDTDLQRLYRQYQVEPETYLKILEMKCQRLGRIGPTMAEAAQKFGKLFLHAVKHSHKLVTTAKQRNLARRLSKFSYLAQQADLDDVSSKQLNLMVKILSDHYQELSKADKALDTLESTTLFLSQFKLPGLCCGKHIKRNWTCSICEPEGSIQNQGCIECLPLCVDGNHHAHNNFATASTFDSRDDCSVKCINDDCNNVVCRECYAVNQKTENFDTCDSCNELYCKTHGKVCGIEIPVTEKARYCNNRTCDGCGVKCSFCDSLVSCRLHHEGLTGCNLDGCEIVFCASCLSAARYCDVCHEISCAKHSYTCEVCGIKMCVNHSNDCEICHNKEMAPKTGKMCTKHADNCSTCTETICQKCISKVGCVFESAKSGNVYCLRCVVKCAICDEEVCEEHYGKCAECEELFCLDHYAICEKCKKNVCDKCEHDHS